MYTLFHLLFLLVGNARKILSNIVITFAIQGFLSRTGPHVREERHGSETLG